MTTNNRKVLIIGLDGGTWTVLKPAIEQGYMPFLRSLVDNGVSGVLESIIPAITPAAWGGFQTGKNPGKTGVFDFAYLDVKQQKTHYVNSRDLGVTLWDILSQYGKRIAVINVPMTYPPKPINGYLISGLVTPSLDSDFTWPLELKEELLKEVPEYKIFDLKQIVEYRSEDKKLGDFLDQLLSIVDNRTRAALWILQKELLDVFMVHFQATDVLQHVYWHYLDPSNPLFDSSKQSIIFEKFYRILDQKMEKIHKAFSQRNGQSLAMVISDHGFQSHYKRFNLGNWLEVKGYLKIRKNASFNKVPILKKITSYLRIGKIAKHLFPVNTIEKFDKKYISKSELYDWDTSIACSVGRSGEGFIYLLTGSEHDKILLAEKLREELLQIRDMETGKPVVRQVWFKHELYHGSLLERIPDIILDPVDGYSFTGYYQPNEGLIHTVNTKDDMHMGKHHREGVFIVSGTSVVSGEKIRASILDLTPTLLAFMVIPVPEEMDGIVLSQWLNIPGSGTISKSTEKKHGDGGPQGMRFSKKESDEIENRLKDLGYL